MFKKVLLIFLFGLFTLLIMVFTSYKFVEITDLVHKETESFDIKKGENTNLENYKINEVLLIPYLRQNPFKTYEDEYFNYSLRLAAYRQNDTGKVVINDVTIEKVKEVKYYTITKKIDKELVFSKDDNIQQAEILLIDEINDYNMELNNKSQIKVILNISVEKDGKILTQDLEYVFGTSVRRYLVKRE